MKNTDKKNTIIIAVSLALLAIVSLTSVFFIVRGALMEQDLVAEIYQDGMLIQSIPLSQVTESYTLQMHSADGGYNEIEVRPGAIGILSADCPDQYCVDQGFIFNSVMPITCLPHRLVIQIHGEEIYDNR